MLTTTGILTANTTSAGGTWTNPNNVFLNDGLNATASTGTFGNLDVTNFYANIPVGSLIQGVEINVSYFWNAATAPSVSFQLLKAGVPVGDIKTVTTNNTTKQTITLGGKTDLFGTTLTVADILASNFGVRVTGGCSAGNIAIDQLDIKVHYAPANYIVNQVVQLTPGQVSQAGAGVGWASITNVLADDGSAATVTLPAGTAAQIITVNNPQFRIPRNATVTGIKLSVEGQIGSAVTHTVAVRLVGNGINAPSFNLTPFVVGYNVRSVGGLGDTLGYLPVISQINDSSFGFEIAVTNTSGSAPTVFIDFVNITVYYSQVLEPVYNLSKIKPFLLNQLTRRVDWVNIGDSNELFNGDGQNHGMQFALWQNAPTYATGLLSSDENKAVGSQQGYFFGTTNNAGRAGGVTGAPTLLNQYMPGNSSTGGTTSSFAPAYYWYMAGGVSDSNNTGMFISPNGPFDVNAKIKGHLIYGTFVSGTDGNFQPQIRRGNSPFTSLALDTLQTTVTGANTLQERVLSVAAGVRDYQIDLRWRQGGNSVSGQFFGLWLRMQLEDVLAGWSLQSLIAVGGASLRTYIQYFQEAPLIAPQSYLSYATYLQSGVKTCIVKINAGLNDRNNTTGSLGPIGNIPSNTAGGYEDNLQGIINALKGAWVAGGNDLANLYFLLLPSHPIATQDDSNLVTYRQVAKDVSDANANTAVVDMQYFNTSLQANAAAFYASGGSDTSHLSTLGYERMMLYVINSLLEDAYQTNVITCCN